jgi:hypothetical protein
MPAVQADLAGADACVVSSWDWQRSNDIADGRAVAMARTHGNRGWPDSKGMIRSFGENRICSAPACRTRLSRQQPGRLVLRPP